MGKKIVSVDADVAKVAELSDKAWTKTELEEKGKSLETCPMTPAAFALAKDNSGRVSDRYFWGALVEAATKKQSQLTSEEMETVKAVHLEQKQEHDAFVDLQDDGDQQVCAACGKTTKPRSWNIRTRAGDQIRIGNYVVVDDKIEVMCKACTQQAKAEGRRTYTYTHERASELLAQGQQKNAFFRKLGASQTRSPQERQRLQYGNRFRRPETQ